MNPDSLALNRCLSGTGLPRERDGLAFSSCPSCGDSGAGLSAWGSGALLGRGRPHLHLWGSPRLQHPLTILPWLSLLLCGCCLHPTSPSPAPRSVFTFSICEHLDLGCPGIWTWSCHWALPTPGCLGSEPSDQGEARSLLSGSSLTSWPKTCDLCPRLPQSPGAVCMTSLAPLSCCL